MSLLIVLFFTVNSSTVYSKSFDFSLSVSPNVPFYHDGLEGDSASYEDGYGDTYYFSMDPLKESTKSNEIILYSNYTINKLIFSFGLGKGMPNDDKSYKLYDIGGGLILFDNDKIRLDTKVYYEEVDYEFKYDEYGSAWPGDPGYYTGGSFIDPGTPIYASSLGSGFKYKVSLSYKISERSNLILSYNMRDIKFDELHTTYLGEHDLNFDASGSYFEISYNLEI